MKIKQSLNNLNKKISSNKTLNTFTKSKMFIYLIYALVFLFIFNYIKKSLSKKSFVDVQNVNVNDADFKYKQIAELLFSSMDMLGTDTKAMLNALSPLNANELFKVYKYFGKRPYCDGGSGGCIPLLITPINADLFQWFQNELSDFAIFGKSELEQMREIWAKTTLHKF